MDSLGLMPKSMKKDRLMAVFPVGLIFIVLIFAACSRWPSRTQTVAAYERAINAHQIDPVLALFTDDATISFAGMGPTLSARSLLAAKAQYDSALGTVTTITIIRLRKDTVFARAAETNKWLTQAGLPPNVYSNVAFTIVGGKIKNLRAELSDSSATKINSVMEQLIPWAEKNEPGKLEKLMPGGGFSYSVESARISLELLKDWQREKHQGIAHE